MGSAFIQVEVRRQGRGRPSQRWVEVELRSGDRLRISGSVDAAAVAALVRALRQWRGRGC